MGRIFISYSTKNVDFAEKLRSFLLRDKIDVWMAPYSIAPGKEFAEEIVHGIQDSDIFLLLLSKASNDSPHVLREVSMAVTQNKKIISLRLEYVKPSLSMAYYLESIQWYDALSGDDESMNQLVSDLKKIMDNSSVVQPVPNKIATEEPGWFARKKKMIALAAGAAAVITAAVIVIGSLNHSSTDSNKKEQMLANTEAVVPEEEEQGEEVQVMPENGSEEVAEGNEGISVEPEGENTQEVSEDKEEPKEKKDSQKDEDDKKSDKKESEEKEEEKGSSVPVIRHDLSSGKKNSGAAQGLSASDSEEEGNAPAKPASKEEPASEKKEGKQEGKKPQKEEQKTAAAADQISVGSLLRFGTYHPSGYSEANNDEEIDWIVIDVDKKNETALLLSASILDVKAFDVSESGECRYDKKGSIINREKSYSDETMTEFYGSSDWSTSNIRTWLNSDKVKVSYPDQAPVKNATSIGYNGYEKQPGFLARFTDAEKNRIMVRENKTTGNSMQPSVVTSSDRVFLLSVEETDRYLLGNNISLYAPLTKSARASDASPWIEVFDEQNASCFMWVLRTPANDNAYTVMVIGGDVDYVADYSFDYANTCAFGIRPAVQLNLKGAALSGDGSEGSPYVLE